MNVVFLISDDHVWAPSVLERYLKQSGEGSDVKTVGIVAVRPLHCEKNKLSFLGIYLNMLYPMLFALRLWQALLNMFRAELFNTTTSVEKIAKKYNIPFQKCRDINAEPLQDWLTKKSPDVIFSIQTQFIKGALREVAKRAFVNIHPSKLPAHRGPAPIFWVLHDREKETAITAHHINENYDDGAIIHQHTIDILPQENYYSLSEKITEAMPALLSETLRKIDAGAPTLSNKSFEGCYQSYPSVKEAFGLHSRFFLRLFQGKESGR